MKSLRERLGLGSKVERELPTPAPPSDFEVYGGWAATEADPLAALDDDGSTARREGVSVAAQLERDRVARQKEARAAALARVPRGRDYSRGLAG